MLTVRSSAHIRNSRHRASSSAPWARAGVTRLLREWLRLLNAESRRLWLADRWSAHARRVQSRQRRRAR
jgi:hypothetical protein